MCDGYGTFHLKSKSAQQRVLVVGCGGGLLTSALGRLFWKKQNIRLDVIESDGRVIEIARKFFGMHVANDGKEVKGLSPLDISSQKCYIGPGSMASMASFSAKRCFSKARRKKKMYTDVNISKLGDVIPANVILKEFKALPGSLESLPQNSDHLSADSEPYDLIILDIGSESLAEQFRETRTGAMENALHELATLLRPGTGVILAHDRTTKDDAGNAHTDICRSALAAALRKSASTHKHSDEAKSVPEPRRAKNTRVLGEFYLRHDINADLDESECEEAIIFLGHLDPHFDVSERFWDNCFFPECVDRNLSRPDLGAQRGDGPKEKTNEQTSGDPFDSAAEKIPAMISNASAIIKEANVQEDTRSQRDDSTAHTAVTVQDRRKPRRASREYWWDVDEDQINLRSMNLGNAQQTDVVRVPGFFDENDIAMLRQLSLSLFSSLKDKRSGADYGATGSAILSDRADESHSTCYDVQQMTQSQVLPLCDGKGGIPSSVGSECRSHDKAEAWKVLFFQENGMWQRLCPQLDQKILALVRRVDREAGWNLIGSGPCNVRVVEYHRQIAPSPGLPDPWHYDQDSLITFDVLLNDPERDFDGGVFQTLEADGTLKAHSASMGDALLFVSHKYHCVTPVTRGTRHVLVIEYWRYSQRYCGHRCEVVGNRVCPRDVQAKMQSEADINGIKTGTIDHLPKNVDHTTNKDEFTPELPMRLGNVSYDDISGLFRILWQENNYAAVEAQRKDVPMAAPADASWDLFD